MGTLCVTLCKAQGYNIQLTKVPWVQGMNSFHDNNLA